MAELDELEARIVLGVEAESFLKTRLGIHLVRRAERERASLLEKLAKVDPEDPKAIRNIQNAISVIDHVQQWLADAQVGALDAIARQEQLDSND